MKVTPVGLVLLIAVLGASAPDAATQEQEKPSIAEAARRTREEKKNQQKPKQIWTNDNIPTTPGAVSVVGKALEPTPEATTEASPAKGEKPGENAAGKPSGAAPGDEGEKKTQEQSAAADELAKAKEHLGSVQTDLDLLQRDYNLQQQQFYGKPDFASDKEGKAKLDALGQQVEAKRQEVQEAQQKVSELEQKSHPEKKNEGPPSS